MIEALETDLLIKSSELHSPENLRFMPVRTAVIGVGGISTPYVEYLKHSPEVSLISCADRDLSFATRRAQELGVNSATSMDEVLNDPTIEMVINLTNPTSHAVITRASLEAGKHVFTEKPLATTFDDGKELVELAQEKDLYLACCPDTFLGPNMQTARQMIDEGLIGDIVRVSGFLKDMGPTHHKNPEPFFSNGGGPVFDWGPYYLTNAVSLLGPIESVIADGGIIRKERRVENTESPRSGQIFPVTVPTDVSSILRFQSGVKMDLVLSFELTGASKYSLEMYGMDGALRLATPNQYNGSLTVGKNGGVEFEEVPLSAQEIGNGVRGYGVTEFARAIRTGQKSRVDAKLGLHVLEAMEAIHTAVETDKRQYLTTTVERPDRFSF